MPFGCGDMAVFDFSRWRSSAILDFQKLEILIVHTLRKAKVRHQAKFCADRANRCGDMAVFDFSRWRLSAILDFQKLEILTAHTLRRAKMRHHAKFCADRSNRCGVIGRFLIFQDGDCPPSWICYTPVWTTHEVYFGGLCHCTKFGLNRCGSFDNMQVLIFWALSLKTPIHAPFWVFLGQKWGKTETLCMFVPLGMQLTWKHAFWGIICQNRSSGLTPSGAKETIK